jgi:hypothetical protein
MTARDFRMTARDFRMTARDFRMTARDFRVMGKYGLDEIPKQVHFYYVDSGLKAKDDFVG